MKIYLDHIGIACENLEKSSGFWKLLGLIQGEDELVEDQGVTTRFFSTSDNDPKVPKEYPFQFSSKSNNFFFEIALGPGPTYNIEILKP